MTLSQVRKLKDNKVKRNLKIPILSTMLLKRAVIQCSNTLSRNISYVQRARLLEKIKNDDEFCKQSMEKGRFLLYSKGQPLLRRGAGPRDHSAHYVDYSYCDKVCRSGEYE